MPKLTMKNLAQSLCFKKFPGLETGILHHSAGSIYHTGSSLLCHGQCCCLRLPIHTLSFFFYSKNEAWITTKFRAWQCQIVIHTKTEKVTQSSLM